MLLLSSYRVKFPITIHLIDDVATCGFDSLSWRQTNSEFINSDSSHFQVSCDPNMTFFPLHQEKETDSLNHTRCWSGIYYFSQTICKLKKRKSLKRLIPTLKGLILNDGIWALQYIIKSMHWGRNRIYIGGKKLVWFLLISTIFPQFCMSLSPPILGFTLNYWRENSHRIWKDCVDKYI